MYSGTLMSVDCQVLDSVEAVEPIVAQWDELAVRFEKPYCAPAWLMAWWRHAAPPNARLRIVAARDGDRLVGVAPFYAVPWVGGLWTWSLMGTDTTSRIEPLATPEAQEAVATAIAAAIDRADPPADRIRLEGLPADSPALQDDSEELQEALAAFQQQTGVRTGPPTGRSSLVSPHSDSWSKWRRFMGNPMGW